MDFREKILREGTLKHRQSGALARVSCSREREIESEREFS